MADISSGLMGHGQLTTIDQSELSSQLGLSLGGSAILPPAAQSPEERLSPTPSPTSSMHEEETEEIRRKQKPAKKQKKKKDPNEPQKPVSAYALFFRDTQAAIKGQNPKATFGEVSKIVASMWDSLGEEQKQVYKRKTEAAKKEYLKALAAYRDNQECQTVVETVELDPISSPSEQPAPAVESASPPAPMPPTPPALESPPPAPTVVSTQPTVVVTSGGGLPTPMHVELVSESPVALSPHPRCVRAGCDNPPVANSEWDNEYCSNECVVKHCRWVGSQGCLIIIIIPRPSGWVSPAILGSSQQNV
uniref:HMG box domain-containing protein n=1 Tax=Podarcis muralis TaxID=64176 RepID=A0A670JA27_PODMU